MTRTIMLFALSLTWSTLALAADSVDSKAAPGPEAPETKLGEEFKTADSTRKLVLISIASAERKLNYKETADLLRSVTLAELKKGRTSKEKLELLGKLRAAGKKAMTKINRERRKAKKSYASFREPTTAIQQAVAIQYVADTAGPKPTLTQLECLAVVRENTNWAANASLCLAYIGGALLNDSDYLAADFKGRLTILKQLTLDKKMMTSGERTYLEKAVLSRWLSGQLNSGKKPDAMIAQIKELGKQNLLSFFTRSWAEQMLKAMARVE